MNITDFKDKIKSSTSSHHMETALVILILVTCSLISFYLGRSSIEYNTIDQDSPKTAQIDENNYSLADPVETIEYRAGSLAAAIQSNQESSKIDPGVMNTEPNRELSTDANLGQNTEAVPRYVASKKGRVYYFTWCNGAKNILAENKIYFDSAKEAREAGLNPSTACPGLD